MIYLFEDNKDDLLSQLYCKAYPDEVKSNFIYTNGNGNLCSVAHKHLKNSDVSIFLDMVPDNENCREVYMDLRKISIDTSINSRLIIFPIVCREYYMIKTLCQYTHYIDSNTSDVDIALNKGDYRKSSIYIHNGRPCKNFEKYCKAVLRRHAIDCIKHTSRLSDNSINERYGLYYCSDCYCDRADNMCNKARLISKALKLLSVYDIVPAGSLTSNRTSIDNKVQVIHRHLVDEYNSMLNRYIDLNLIKSSKRVRKNTPLTNKLLLEIEQGKYDTGMTFIDRFGAKLYSSELSTGCKAALLTSYMPDCVIDTIECGYNARDAIIHNCTEGNIIIYNTGRTFTTLDNDHCDVYMHGHIFRTVNDLNTYIRNCLYA